jgi:hypothetical protein
MTIEVSEPYCPRSIGFLELWEVRGWRVKIYGIAKAGETPAPALVEAAKRIAAERLPEKALGPQHYGVAFIIIHEGANGDYVLVDWWSDQDIVQHHLYGAPKGHGGELEYGWPEGAGFCVWELAVCCFEREAWLDCVLKRPGDPDLEAYLSRRMNKDV